ncbi:MAG TPA: phosphoribosylamine--glycine ligase [Candidatus Limnocylindrales bacterium]|nr:phosphoribosylamine--glycine ligase [Candidatus Limnocylindrales bacterium]
MATDASPAGAVGVSLVMPTRIVVVGGGAREHALAWKLAGEPGVNEVVVAPGSAAIAAEPRVRSVTGVDPLDPAAVVAVARREAAELVVVGPEAPLAAGVADSLRDAGFAVFGPSQAAARIESSKAFCHEVARAAGVPMARSAAFDDARAAAAFAAELAAEGRGVVIKADGLAAGKGVIVCDSAAEAERAIDQLAAGAGAEPSTVGGPWVVVEERLRGREASLIALCDGRDAVALPLARDHKRLLDGERGPNTGGMGASSPLPDLPDAAADELLAAFHRPILAELARRGTPFRGALYAGLMLTEDGPVLLECNARFGDPETQATLPRLAVALGPILLACARGDLGPIKIGAAWDRPARVPTLPGAAVAIVLAAAGYPDAPHRGDRIDGLADAASMGALVFHAGTAFDPDGTIRTAGGRVLTIVGRGPDVEAARASAAAAADRIHAPGLQHRTDIGVIHADATRSGHAAAAVR